MPYNRISARRGSPVALNVNLLKGGQLQAPAALYRVEIYRGKVATENIVDVIEIPDPNNVSYPSPITGSGGQYVLNWNVPADAIVPDVYFDVWWFYSTDPRDGSGSIGSNPADPLSNYEDKLLDFCNRFWVYPDQWYADGGLQTLRLAFEPLDQRYYKNEVRPLEIGLMPLPLYDYDYNFVTPLLPYLDGKISIWTENNELIIDAAPMDIKLRMGSYRSNPFVMSYLLDTTAFFIGTYKYRVSLTLPDGTTRVSGDFFLTIA